jgi:hypothetical protein
LPEREAQASKSKQQSDESPAAFQAADRPHFPFSRN